MTATWRGPAETSTRAMAPAGSPWRARDATERSANGSRPAAGSPSGGLEELFRQLPVLGIEADPESMAELAGRYHCDPDFERTFPIVARHGRAF